MVGLMGGLLPRSILIAMGVSTHLPLPDITEMHESISGERFGGYHDAYDAFEYTQSKMDPMGPF
jgi:hypothetical protein